MKVKIESTRNNLTQYGHILTNYKLNGAKEIEINSIEELFNLKKELDCELIITEGYKDEITLEIYNGHRE